MGLLSTLIYSAASYIGFRAYIRGAKLPAACTYSFEEACLRAGYPLQTYLVPTKDGYILRLYRIQKHGSAIQPQGKKPVLMVHGIAHSAHAYIVAQKAKAPAFQLADLDFDVWLANTRGAYLSQMHLTLDPSSPKFWDFSAQDLAEKDLPALIDFILASSKTSSIGYVGHSQASHLLMHMLAFLPEYNQKVNIGVLLAPFCGLIQNNAKYYSIFAQKYLSFRKSPSVMADPTATNFAKFLVRFPGLAPLLTKVRYDISITKDDPAVIPVYWQRLIGGTSVKNVKYWIQIREAMNPCPRKFDYGQEKNQLEYGSSTPPQLDYGKIKVPLAIFGGKHDLNVSQRNIEVLRMQLTRDQVVFYKLDYNLDHGGFICSNDLSYFSDVIKVLQGSHAKAS